RSSDLDGGCRSGGAATRTRRPRAHRPPRPRPRERSRGTRRTGSTGGRWRSGRPRSRRRSGRGASARSLLGVESDDGPMLIQEIRTSYIPDSLGPDLLDLREKPVSEVPGRDALSRAEQHPLERDAVLLVPRPGADLWLRPLDLRPTRRGATQLVDLPIDRVLDSVERDAFRRGRGCDQEGRIELHLLPHADIRRELRLDEGPIQPVRPRAPVPGREG